MSEHTISFTIKGEPTKEQIAFADRILKGCFYVLVSDENGINIENSFCDKCGFDLNNCKTYAKQK